jgi:hypothetical protein
VFGGGAGALTSDGSDAGTLMALCEGRVGLPVSPEATPRSRVQGPARCACSARAAPAAAWSAALRRGGGVSQAIPPVSTTGVRHHERFHFLRCRCCCFFRDIPDGAPAIATLSARERSVLEALRPFLGADAEVLCEAQGRSLHKPVCFARDSSLPGCVQLARHTRASRSCPCRLRGRAHSS